MVSGTERKVSKINSGSIQRQGCLQSLSKSGLEVMNDRVEGPEEESTEVLVRVHFCPSGWNTSCLGPTSVKRHRTCVRCTSSGVRRKPQTPDRVSSHDVVSSSL